MMEPHGISCVRERYLTVTRYIKIAIVLGVVSVAVVFGLVLRFLELPDTPAPSLGAQSAQTLAAGTSPTTVASPPASPSTSAVVAVANAFPNVHTTSGLASPKIGTLSRGERAEVIGRTADSAWLEIRFAGSANGTGWVSGDLMTVPPGAVVPVVTPP
jgi:hypothetical protein